MSQAELLLDLQSVDSVIDRQNQRLAEIKAALHETDELIAARAAHQAAEQSVTHNRVTRKDLELADTTLETKIKQAEQRLYSGLVKNPKELLDLQNDIASLKKQKNSLDDQLFAAMIALEESESELALRAADDTQIETAWRESQHALIAEQAQLGQELAEQLGDQSTLRGQLSASVLSLYDQLRRRKGGLAVVELEGSICGGCRVRVTAQILQQLGQADQLARCGNCERILVRV